MDIIETAEADYVALVISGYATEVAIGVAVDTNELSLEQEAELRSRIKEFASHD